MKQRDTFSQQMEDCRKLVMNSTQKVLEKQYGITSNLQQRLSGMFSVSSELRR